MTLHTHIIGTGAGLPKTCLSNDALIAQYHVDSSHEWIESRTGITQRYICTAEETVASLSIDAARDAMAAADVSAADIDLIIVATCTPDAPFPSVAMRVQQALQTRHIPAFDINAACSGFIYALTVAESLLQMQHMKTALVIGAEKFSSLMNWADRSTCVLFGDGAGAVVLQRQEQEGGFMGARIHADGQGADALCAQNFNGGVYMNGREVFKHAVRAMGHIENDWLSQFGTSVEGLDWLIPHQANKRILLSSASSAGVSQEKVIQTVQLHANTSAASIPLALHTAVSDGRIQRGQWIYMQSFGAGFTWGEALFKF